MQQPKGEDILFKSIYLLFQILSLKSNEHKSPDKILKIREKKFRRIIKYAYKHSEFYRDYYKKHGIEYKDLSTVPIRNLPATDKEMVIENFDDIVTRKDIKKSEVMNFANHFTDPLVTYKGKYHVINTSGSSGKKGVFVYNNFEYIKAFSCSSRMNVFKLGKKKTKVAYYAKVEGRCGGVSLVKFSQCGMLKRFFDTCFLEITKPAEETVAKLNKFQPDILIGYGAGLEILAKYQEEEKLHIKPRIIVNGGEGISDKGYKLIESVFCAPIMNMYAATETYYLGVGKDEFGGVYLMDDFNYIEVMDGYVLVTNLYNYTQPTIRYRMDDKLTLKEDTAKKLPFRLVESVIGRSEKPLILINENGEKDYIHPLAFNSFYIKGVEKYQILSKSNSSFDFIAVVPDGKGSKEIEKEIKFKLDRILESKNMSNAQYNIVFTRFPMIDKGTGKCKLIVNSAENQSVNKAESVRIH